MRTEDIPRVTVAIPVYNGGRWIQQTIESVLNQTYDDFELVISDNRSTDNTVEICESFAKQDARVRIHQNESNIGAALNFNKAYDLSRAAYFKWASSNDLLAPTMLEKCVDILDSHPDAAIAAPKTQIIDENNEITSLCQEEMHLISEDPFERFVTFLERVQLNNLEQALIRSSVLEKTKLQAVYPGSDMILVAELVARGKVFEIPEYLLSRRLAKSSTTNLMEEHEIATFYSPTHTRIPHVALRMFFALVSAASRLEVPFRVRAKFYRYAIRHLRWARGQIARDLIDQFKRGIGLSRS